MKEKVHHPLVLFLLSVTCSCQEQIAPGSAFLQSISEVIMMRVIGYLYFVLKQKVVPLPCKMECPAHPAQKTKKRTLLKCKNETLLSDLRVHCNPSSATKKHAEMIRTCKSS